jgi:heme exporter protein C
MTAYHFSMVTMRHIIPIIPFIVLTPAAVYLSLAAPAEVRMGEISRLLYLHVPLAMCSVFSFAVSAVFAAFHLRKSSPAREIMFHYAAKLGLIFTVLTTATGAIWAKSAWGSWWNWDPRETSIVFLLIMYLAYFVFSSSLDGKHNAARLRAVYLLFAVVPMPFFVFVIPRVLPSLHPDTIINADRAVHLTGEMRLALFVSMAAMLSLLAALLVYRKRKASGIGSDSK